MIPKVAKSGRSFKGAALYYLHDKGAMSDERVAWTHTLNLPTDDPDRAIAHMIDTAEHAGELKAAAGLKAGRKLQNPVYAYSLAWSPDEAPSKAEQFAAAKETIKTLGLDKHQTLIVAHTDTDHPHVHIIVNRVCPETGKAAVMSNDRLKLSEWAQEYEQRNGKIHCQERVKNNADRKRGQWRKHNAESRRQWYEWRKGEAGKVWQEFKAEKDAAFKDRKPQYDALWRQRKNRIDARQWEIKTLYKPLWRDMFKRHRAELKEFDNSWLARVRFAFADPAARHESPIGFLTRLLDARTFRGRLLKQQEIERVNLSYSQKGRISDAQREIHKAWQYDRDKLKAMHKEQDQERYKGAQKTTDAIWKDGRPEQAANHSERSQQAENHEKTNRTSFDDAVRENIGDDRYKQEFEKAAEAERKERKRNRSRNRGRGRERTRDL